jgi:thioredoxin-related protein
MKFLIAFLLPFTMSVNGWHYNFEEAKHLAKQEHRYILLNFSGSDWCGPCIRMHKEILESAEFTQLADQKLVLMNADFPRMKKNQLPAAQQQQNNVLADQYNPKGNFPYTVLLDADGKVLKEWNGFPNLTAAAFTQQVKSVVEAGQ